MEEDPLIADLRAAQVPWGLQLYSGSPHGFDNPSNPHEARADREYKQSIRRFFTEIFGR